MAPVEVGLKSPRIEFASVEHNDEALFLNLDFLDEKCEQILKRTEDYQRRTTRYYNQKIKPKSYKPGDLVLKKSPANKEKSSTWKTRARLGRPLYRDSCNQTWQLRTPDGIGENSTSCLER